MSKYSKYRMQNFSWGLGSLVRLGAKTIAKPAVAKGATVTGLGIYGINKVSNGAEKVGKKVSGAVDKVANKAGEVNKNVRDTMGTTKLIGSSIVGGLVGGAPAAILAPLGGLVGNQIAGSAGQLAGGAIGLAGGTLLNDYLKKIKQKKKLMENMNRQKQLMMPVSANQLALQNGGN